MKVLLCFSGVCKMKFLLLNILSVRKYFTGGFYSVSFGFAAEYQPGFGDESKVRVNGHWRTGEAFSPGQLCSGYIFEKGGMQRLVNGGEDRGSLNNITKFKMVCFVFLMDYQL